MKTDRRESAVLAGVIAYLLSRNDVFFWRNQTGATKFHDFFLRFGTRGSADILGVKAWQSVDPSTVHGQFLAIECKREKGGAQSKDQKIFQQNIENHGGLYILASSIADVELALGAPNCFVQKVRKQRVVPR